MEIWKDIVGYESLYQVSNLGRVKRLSSITWVNKNDGFYRNNPEIIMKPIMNLKGYLHINLYKDEKLKSFRINRLVLTMFDRLPKVDEVAMHLDNNRSNNCLSNLKWGTNKENTAQKYNDGRNPDIRGIKNPMVKHSEEDVIRIKKLYKYNNLPVNKIAKQVNKSYNFVYEVVNNLKWKHVTV